MSINVEDLLNRGNQPNHIHMINEAFAAHRDIYTEEWPDLVYCKSTPYTYDGLKEAYENGVVSYKDLLNLANR